MQNGAAGYVDNDLLTGVFSSAATPPAGAAAPLLAAGAVAVPIYSAAPALPADFDGHYKDYDVPYFFNQLVMSFYNLRDICRTGKYNQAFRDAQRDLIELLTIIANNDLDEGDAALGTSSIELRYGQVSQRLDDSLKVIVNAKNTKDAAFLESIAQAGLKRTLLIDKITYAFNARTPSPEYPEPKFKQNSLTPPQLKDLIDQLPTPPKSRSFIQKAIHIFPHAYHHSRELSITAIIFSIGALCTAGQSTIDHFFDNPSVAAEDRPSTAATFAFPVVLGLLGLGFGIAALATSHRKQLKRCFGQRRAKLPGGGSSFELGATAAGAGNIQGSGSAVVVAAPAAFAAPPTAAPVSSAPPAHLVAGAHPPPPPAMTVPPAARPVTPPPAAVAAPPASPMHGGSSIMGGFAPAIPHRVPFPGGDANANVLLRYLQGEVGNNDIPLQNNGNHEKAVAALRAYIPTVDPHDVLAGKIKAFFDANGISESVVQFGFS